LFFFFFFIENSPRVRPPPIPESTSLASSEQPTVSVKKLLVDTSSTRSTSEHNNTNTKLLDRRSTPRKPSHSDIYPQLRIFSLANQRQHRQSSAAIPPTSLLPNVPGKKPDETYRTLQRSKTLDVVLDIPNPIKVTSRFPVQPDNPSSNQHQHTTNRTIDQTPSRFFKRSAFNIRSEQQKSTSVIQKSRQHFYNSSTTTTVPTNKVLIHFNHNNNGNSDRHYLVPE
jgi:hypothetical protein